MPTETPKPDADVVDAGPERQAVEKAADENVDPEEDMTSQERNDATNWFLGKNAEGPSKVWFKLNVSEDSRKKEWVTWAVQAIPRERIQEIRNENKTGEAETDVDSAASNLQIAVEGTHVPNLREVRGAFADPGDALKAKFSFKPGLIDQIANKVLKATGYDDEDVQEINAVKD